MVKFAGVSSFHLHFKRSSEVWPSLAAYPSSHPALDGYGSLLFATFANIFKLLLDYFTVTNEKIHIRRPPLAMFQQERKKKNSNTTFWSFQSLSFSNGQRKNFQCIKRKKKRSKFSMSWRLKGNNGVSHLAFNSRRRDKGNPMFRLRNHYQRDDDKLTSVYKITYRKRVSCPEPKTRIWRHLWICLVSSSEIQRWLCNPRLQPVHDHAPS